MDETRILNGLTEELAALVQEFRNTLGQLNKGAAPCSLEEARAEAADYIQPNHTVVGLFRDSSLIGFSVVKAVDGVSLAGLDLHQAGLPRVLQRFEAIRLLGEDRTCGR